MDTLLPEIRILPRLLVFGSRTVHVRYKAQVARYILRLVNGELGGAPVMIIHGAAKGADTLAGLIARDQGWPQTPFPADWANNGKAAGPIRNQRMLVDGKPDWGLGFTDKPLEESVGSLDMYQRLCRAEVPCAVVRLRETLPEEQRIPVWASL